MKGVPNFMRLNKASLWLSALMVLAGCPEKKTPQLSAVTVTCAPASVVAGQPSQCSASATDEDGKPFTVSSYSWTSNDESVAKVDSTGQVTTFTVGTAIISASATADGESRQGQATLMVTPQPPRLSTITVTCTPSSVAASRPSQCTATAKDQYGQPFAVSSYAWASSNESVAKVGTTGRVTTSTPGTATVSASATVGGVTQQGQASVTVTTSQPTLHTATTLATSETWRAAENPHVVSGRIAVQGVSTPTLTLEEGVEIRFDPDSELVVTGAALRALGTQEAPIHMVSNQSTPAKGAWRGVVFDGGASTSELNYVTLSDCGNSLGAGACIAMKNQAAPVLRHVTVSNSGTAGVALAEDGSSFGSGSTTLSVSGSEGYAVRIGANEAGMLPTGGTFTSNGLNAVELSAADIDVSRSQTWPNLGIPYVARTSIYVQGGNGGPTLTLSAGTVLRFQPNSGLHVGQLDTAELVVNGTADAPVLFTSASASPQPGEWAGVHLWNNTTSASRISHATIEYGGLHGGTGVGYGDLVVYGNGAGGGARPVITDVTVQKSSEYGVHLLNGGAFGPGSTRLTARDNGSYPISMDSDFASTLPTNSTFNGNTPNTVMLGGNVTRTQTWPNPGIPYFISSYVFLDSATLTLTPGTQLQFDSSSEFWVGYSSPAALIAVGTQTNPIRFSGVDNTSGGRDSWGGLLFMNAAGSRLDFASVSNGGGGGNSNVNVRMEIGAFITNSTFSDSATCGISRNSSVTTDFTLPTYNNTFANNVGGAQCTN